MAESRIMAVLGNDKQCTGCRVVKPRREFHQCAAGRDGLKSRCKACTTVFNRKYRAANLEKTRAAVRRWNAANPDKRRANDREWRAANPEKTRAISSASQRRRRKASPEKVRAADRKRYAASTR